MAVVLLATGMACSGTERLAGSTTTSSGPTVPPAAPPPTPLPATVPPTVSGPTLSLTDGCDPPAGPPWDEFGSIHTIVAPPNSNEVTVTVEPAQAVCPSGVVEMRITVANVSDVAQTMVPGRGLLLSGGPNKYQIAMVSAVDLAPGEVTTFVVTTYLPPAPPGRYWLVIEGYGPGGEIVLLDPATQ
jgi:hypothetical protein